MTSNAQKGKKCGSTEGGNRVGAVIRAPAGREEAARTGELDIQNLASIFCEPHFMFLVAEFQFHVIFEKEA